MNGYIVSFGVESGRQAHAGATLVQFQIKDGITTIAIKMAMLSHIGTKPRGAALECNLPHQPALDQGGQTIIHCRHRNRRHDRLRDCNQHFE